MLFRSIYDQTNARQVARVRDIASTLDVSMSSVTGALKVSWKGDAMATPSGDGTLYQARNDKDSWVTVTTASGDTPATVALTVKGTTYAVPDKSVEIDESDNGLSASAATEVAKGKTAKVKARFTCDKTNG